LCYFDKTLKAFISKLGYTFHNPQTKHGMNHHHLGWRNSLRGSLYPEHLTVSSRGKRTLFPEKKCSLFCVSGALCFIALFWLISRVIGICISLEYEFVRCGDQIYFIFVSPNPRTAATWLHVGSMVYYPFSFLAYKMNVIPFSFCWNQNYLEKMYIKW
jgi:hypothetical protein